MLRRPIGSAWWALAAVLAGGTGGLALSGGISGLRIIIALVAGAVAVGIVWRWQIGVVAMLVALPLDIAGRLVSKPVAITVYQLALILTLLSFAWAVGVARTQRLKFSLVDVAWALLMLAALWSLPYSLSRSATVVATIRLLFLWAFTLLAANAFRMRRVADAAIATLGITGLASALLAIAQVRNPALGIGNVVVVHGGSGAVTYRVSAFFEDPNYFAGFLVSVIIVGLASLVFARTKRTLIAWGAVTVICLYALSVTLSRTGYIGIAAGALVLLLVAPRKRRRWLVAATLALVVLVVMVNPASLVKRIVSITDVSGDRSIATRVYMYVSAAEIIGENWAMGTGLAAFDRAYPSHRKLGTRADITKPHELPLAMWAEMGVAGLVAEIALMAAIIAMFWRKRSRGWTRYEALAAAGIASMLIQSLFQYYLYFEYLWLFVAFAVAANYLAPREEEGSNV